MRFFNWIMKGLRRLASSFPNKAEVLKAACVGKKRNTQTGRMAAHYICAECNDIYPKNMVQIDHIDPVVPVEGWRSWDDTVKRLFCTVDGLQVLCRNCHSIKSIGENAKRPRVVRKRKAVPRMKPTRLRVKKQ